MENLKEIENRINFLCKEPYLIYDFIYMLRIKLGKYNIRVNAVLPGMIKTDRWDKNPEFYANVPSRFTPLQDVAVGEDVADAV